MKIFYHKDDNGNIGDDLNRFIWEKLLPIEFNGYYYHTPKQNKATCDDSLFVGIGTLLDQNIPKKVPKLIFSSGTGYGESPLIDSSWNIYCVRGPLTAKRLGLPLSKAITDGAALTPKITEKLYKKTYKYSFIPHITTHIHQNYNKVCDELDINYLPPCLEASIFLEELQKSEIIITEAMHGAILADSFRIPWIPVTTHSGINEFKWQDWCLSINLEYNPVQLPSLWIDRSNSVKKLIEFTKEKNAKVKLKSLLTKNTTVISSNKTFNDNITKLEEKLENFLFDYNSGLFND